jgi:lysophospholipase
LKAARFAGFGDAYVPGRYKGVLDLRPFAGNILTSDPVRYARNAAVLEADPELGLGGPTVTWCDAAFRAMRQFHDPAYPARIRQPILIVAAGRDAIVSNTAIEEFAMLLRAGSHLVVTGAQHEILMEQDRYRSQLWAAFDAFVPGTPLY